jgi:hypothetical protein
MTRTEIMLAIISLHLAYQLHLSTKGHHRALDGWEQCLEARRETLNADPWEGSDDL